MKYLCSYDNSYYVALALFCYSNAGTRLVALAPIACDIFLFFV